MKMVKIKNKHNQLMFGNLKQFFFSATIFNYHKIHTIMYDTILQTISYLYLFNFQPKLMSLQENTVNFNL